MHGAEIDRSDGVLAADGRIGRALVAWFGVYQLIHVLVNVRGIPMLARGTIDFPAPPPGEGWHPQLVPFLTAMAVVDTFNAAMSLVYAAAHLRRRPWRHWLGALTMAVSIYATIVFDWSTIASGAWSRHPAPYVFINATFVPVVVLFVLVCRWSVRSARHDPPERAQSPSQPR